MALLLSSIIMTPIVMNTCVMTANVLHEARVDRVKLRMLTATTSARWPNTITHERNVRICSRYAVF